MSENVELTINDVKAELLAHIERIRANGISQAYNTADRQVDKVMKTYIAKKSLIKSAETKEEIDAVKAMFGSDCIYIPTSTFMTAHFISKVLRMKLEKKVRDDGVNYVGYTPDNIRVNIYGVFNPPGCVLKKKVKMQKVTTWELVCPGEKNVE
jgi:hypothetical protein